MEWIILMQQVFKCRTKIPQSIHTQSHTTTLRSEHICTQRKQILLTHAESQTPYTTR